MNDRYDAGYGGDQYELVGYDEYNQPVYRQVPAQQTQQPPQQQPYDPYGQQQQGYAYDPYATGTQQQPSPYDTGTQQSYDTGQQAPQSGYDPYATGTTTAYDPYGQTAAAWTAALGRRADRLHPAAVRAGRGHGSPEGPGHG